MQIIYCIWRVSMNYKERKFSNDFFFSGTIFSCVARQLKKTINFDTIFTWDQASSVIC